ncbi:MAG: GNAT family N-acetyltransferase, partial [Clostridium sp.]
MSKIVDLYRRNGKNVYIKQPEFEELSFISKLWGHEETMADIGGPYIFPKEKWEMFYKKMVQPTDGKNFYCLIYTIRDKAIGEVSFHGFDSATKAARINVKVHYRYRNKGYGEEAVRLLLEYYFLEFKGRAIIDTIKTDNAKKFFNKIGFESIGEFRNQTTYKLTKGDFFNLEAKRKRNIAVITYNNMSMVQYSTIFEIFNEANKILGEDMFNIYSVGVESTVKTNNITVEIDHNTECEDKPDIIIIPGGEGACEAVKDKYIIRYILSRYNSCDYLLSINTGVYFLSRCRMLDGIMVPKIIGTEERLKE